MAGKPVTSSRQKSHVVIADIFMPELRGLRVSRYVLRYLPDVKVILTNAHIEHVYEELGREAGTLGLIPKFKLSRDTLLQALQ